MQISVDGLVSSRDGVDWQLWGWGLNCPWDEKLRSDFNRTFKSVDTILLSRLMATEGYIDHWKHVAEMTVDDSNFDFSRKITRIKKVVATTKNLQNVWPETEVIKGPLAKTIKKLKAQNGKKIIAFGGVRFAQSLLELNLVDELQLYFNPSIIGSGSSIFTELDFRKLKLLASQAYRCGMVVNSYATSS